MLYCTFDGSVHLEQSHPSLHGPIKVYDKCLSKFNLPTLLQSPKVSYPLMFWQAPSYVGNHFTSFLVLSSFCCIKNSYLVCILRVTQDGKVPGNLYNYWLLFTYHASCKIMTFMCHIIHHILVSTRGGT